MGPDLCPLPLCPSFFTAAIHLTFVKHRYYTKALCWALELERGGSSHTKARVWECLSAFEPRGYRPCSPLTSLKLCMLPHPFLALSLFLKSCQSGELKDLPKLLLLQWVGDWLAGTIGKGYL